MATTPLMTVDEFVQMNTAENEAYELVDGELVSVPSPTPFHGIIRDRMLHLIWNYLDRNPIGGAISEIDCRIGGDSVRRPDVSIFLGDRWRQLDLKKVPAPFAPDVVIEVLSPSEFALDINRKFGTI